MEKRRHCTIVGITVQRRDDCRPRKLLDKINIPIVQFMVLRLQGSQDSRDSETPDTLREHDVTHWQKTVNCWDIARFMWIDHLFIPAMLCQQRCVRKSHTHGKNGCVRRYAAGTGVANALKVVQRQCDFISV